jgi:anti-sigma regulatory factor (Ser/Thr protein kinase)
MAFPPKADSVRLARTFVTHQLTDAGLDGAAFTATLLVSELVTNAILHARTECRVEIDTDDGVVRIAVVDASPRPVLRRRHSIESGTGRGLMLVEQLARAWGIDQRGPEKAVWFELTDEATPDEGEPDLDAFLTLDDDLVQEHG